jgi:hypothetical protein
MVEGLIKYNELNSMDGWKSVNGRILALELEESRTTRMAIWQEPARFNAKVQYDYRDDAGKLHHGEWQATVPIAGFHFHLHPHKYKTMK